MFAPVSSLLRYLLYKKASVPARALAAACVYPYYAVINRFSARPLRLPYDTVAKGCIVSLTSYPARLGVAYQAIESIFAQGCKPEKVILWLAASEVQPEMIPASLKRLETRGLEIRYIDPNLGSHKKLYFALREYPQHAIITADDDVYYPKDWLEGFYCSHQQYPHTILCYRGHFLRKQPDGKALISYQEMCAAQLYGQIAPSHALMPTGVSGVLYPANSFDEVFFDQALYQAHSMNGDDIWYKVMALRCGVKALRITACNNLWLNSCFTLQKLSLSSYAFSHGRNDEILRALTGLWPEILTKIEPAERLETTR